MRFLILFLTVSILSGCGGVKRSLGLGRKSADASNVISQDDLVIPPEFSLRPPVEEGEEKDEKSAEETKGTGDTTSQSQVSVEKASFRTTPPRHKEMVSESGLLGLFPESSQEGKVKSSDILDVTAEERRLEQARHNKS